MKYSLLLSFILLASHSWSADDAPVPFTLSVVPGISGKIKSITISKDNPNDFYVVLTNISKDPQPVFESWNSWGFNAISFEFTMPDGKKSSVFRARGVWSFNFPSTFTIPPGEHQVYPIHFDQKWTGLPEINANPEAVVAVKLKAIYHVEKTPESTEKDVWIGRVESKTYDFTLSRSRK